VSLNRTEIEQLSLAGVTERLPPSSVLRALSGRLCDIAEPRLRWAARSGDKAGNYTGNGIV